MPYIKTRNSMTKLEKPRVKNVAARTRETVEKAAEIANPYKDDDRVTGYAEQKTSEAATSVGARSARFVTGKLRPTKTVQKSVKNAQKTIKNAQRSVKQAQRTVKTAKATVKTAKKAAEATVKATQKAAQIAKATAKAAAAAAKAAAQATVAVIKAIIAAVQSLIAFIAAGGWVAVIIILIICMIAFVLFSPYGIFYSSQSFGDSQIMPQVVSELNGEFYDKIKGIENSVAHDALEYEASDGKIAVDWIAVLSIYAVHTSGQTNALNEVATIDDMKIDIIRQIMWDMNEVTYTTRTQTIEREETYTDDKGKEQTRTVTETKTILIIRIKHMSQDEIAAIYGFDAKQNEFLADLMSPEFYSMWASLVGSFRDANGQIFDSDATWVGIGIFSWPMQEGYSITSFFGWRILDGKDNFHSGIDIGAPEGTPVLAAAGGTVTVANCIDPWGGGWGYYVRIHHDGTIYETLYAHCSAIAVYDGQPVEQGQVIGYVGDTGNSRGNHLHFEIYQNGSRVDPLLFFQRA